MLGEGYEDVCVCGGGGKGEGAGNNQFFKECYTFIKQFFKKIITFRKYKKYIKYTVVFAINVQVFFYLSLLNLQ